MTSFSNESLSAFFFHTLDAIILCFNKAFVHFSKEIWSWKYRVRSTFAEIQGRDGFSEDRIRLGASTRAPQAFGSASRFGTACNCRLHQFAAITDRAREDRDKSVSLREATFFQYAPDR